MTWFAWRYMFCVWKVVYCQNRIPNQSAIYSLTWLFTWRNSCILLGEAFLYVQHWKSIMWLASKSRGAFQQIVSPFYLYHIAERHLTSDTMINHVNRRARLYISRLMILLLVAVLISGMIPYWSWHFNPIGQEQWLHRPWPFYHSR